MGPRTQKACQEYGCVYLHGIGGAAQIYAQCIQRILGVSLEQFGSPEAVWELEVRNFPAVVTIDSHGNNLQQVVADKSRESLVTALARLSHGFSSRRVGDAVRARRAPGGHRRRT